MNTIAIAEASATVQICHDDENGTQIRQMAKGIVLSDGRVQFKTAKGAGFLVCQEACEALGLDAKKAVFDASMGEAHYKLNQPLHGKVVRAWVSQSCDHKLNPDWAAYDQGMNEGGDGYNPHQKHVVTKKAQIRHL